MRRVAAATIGISAIVVMWASPASAHPASPTNYHSVVTGIEPPVASVRADIVGGDAFVRVRSNGHEVIVVGYGGEPYLRLSRDGHVQENKASPAGLLNSDRYARVKAPTADPTAVPVWASVGGDGSLLWHDHRVHWMSPRPAPTVDGSGLVQHWELPLLIDGQPVVVQGALYRTSPPTTLWLLAIPALAVLAWIAGRRRWVALAVTAALGAAVFAADGFALSGAARPFPTVALLCVVALLAVVPLWWPRWARPVLRAWAAAVLTFAGWRSWSVLAQTYLPGHVPGGLGRGAVVALVGVGLGALVAEVYPFTRPKQAAAQVSSKMP